MSCDGTNPQSSHTHTHTVYLHAIASPTVAIVTLHDPGERDRTRWVHSCT